MSYRHTRTLHSARCFVAGTLLSTAPFLWAVDNHTDTLPDAKPGECYAKVMVPAAYQDETTTVVVREAFERVEVVPPRYEAAEERVLVAEASTKLVPVEAEWSEETHTVELRPARTEWVTDSLQSNVVVNPQILAAMENAGVDLDEVESGACYHEHFQPPKYRMRSERVLVAQATERYTVIPPEYDLVEERVLVRPASRQLVEIPAEYETVEERVLVEPAKSVWKPGRGPIEKIDGSTGEIMCLVEEPAKYRKVEKRVVKRPASTKVIETPAEYQVVKVRKLVRDAQEVRESVPAKYEEVRVREKVADAEYIWHPVETLGDFGPKTGAVACKKDYRANSKTFTRRMVKTPATFRRVTIPAKYEVKKIRRLAEDAREVRTRVPAETRQVTKRVKTANARLEWRPVLCETNMSDAVIAKVQRALQRAGLNPGPADGMIGRRTLLAVDEYQRQRGLATGGLTMATLDALGVEI